MPIERLMLLLVPDDLAVSSAIESILFISGGPVTVAAIAAALDLPRPRVMAALAEIAQRQVFGIQLQQHGNEVQLVSSPVNHEWVRRFLGASRPPALSRATMETLAVIAYRQPVTRPEIEAARGVNSDRTVQTLLARNLIEEVGHREALGRPMEYGTGFGFLEYFGLRSLDDLPPLASTGDPRMEAGMLGLVSRDESPSAIDRD